MLQKALQSSVGTLKNAKRLQSGAVLVETDNSTYRSAVLDRKKALCKVRASPTAVNLEHYKILIAKAICTIRTALQHSWQSFASKINSITAVKKA